MSASTKTCRRRSDCLCSIAIAKWPSASERMAERKQPPGLPRALGNITSTEDFHQLAAQEEALARAAVTNESRAQHYAMAAYYTRLAQAKEKASFTNETDTPG